MKPYPQLLHPRCLTALSALFFLVAPLPGTGAVLVLDSFSDGAFEIGTGNPQSHSRDPITSDLVDQRWVVGDGLRPWRASVDVVAGVFTYSVDLMDGVTPFNNIVLEYSGFTGSSRLLGYDAFRLTVLGVVGSAQLYAALGGTPGPEFSLLIDRPGEYVYPFSGIEGHPPLDQVGLVSFWFYPETTDFSVTIDEIAVVPEPGAEVLALLGLVGFALRRRRPSGATARARPVN